ncbi:MAG: hypothetical protein ACK5MR_18425 [Cumulibacter sp.]
MKTAFRHAWESGTVADAAPDFHCAGGFPHRRTVGFPSVGGACRAGVDAAVAAADAALNRGSLGKGKVYGAAQVLEPLGRTRLTCESADRPTAERSLREKRGCG